MAYATVSDVEARTTHTYTADEESVISQLLDDAAVLIDIYNANATDAAKKIVSCRMVIRAIGDQLENPHRVFMQNREMQRFAALALRLDFMCRPECIPGRRAPRLT